jgi:cytochrome c oxidase cbb3-type subunit I/II
VLAAVAEVGAAAATVVLALMIAVAGAAVLGLRREGEPFHARLEQRALALGVLAALAALQGGAVQAGGLVLSRSGQDVTEAPYTPLELAGREVYRAQACASCHTQMIRPMLSEVARYGEVLAEVSRHERPPLWGARRVGPDLARVGERHDEPALYRILADAPERMPSYGQLAQRRVDLDGLGRRMRTLAALGVPYGRAEIEGAAEEAVRQGQTIASELDRAGIELEPESEMVALIAYLVRLGRVEAPDAGVGEAQP